MFITQVITGSYVDSIPLFSLIVIVLLWTVYGLYDSMSFLKEKCECYFMLHKCIDFTLLKRREDIIQEYRAEYELLAKKHDKVTRKERRRANLLYEVLTELGEEVKYFDIAVFFDSARYPHKYIPHLGRW